MKQENHYRLNDSEELIGSSDTASLVFDRGGFLLTNQRMIKVDKSPFGATSSVHSINLENLDSVQTVAVKHISLVLFAFALLILLWDDRPIYGIVGFALLLIVYFLTRRKVIQLASANSTMWLNVSPMAHETIQELLFEIEQAKQRRLEGLQHATRSVPAGPMQRLTDLKALLDAGLIDGNEFAVRRKRILDEM